LYFAILITGTKVHSPWLVIVYTSHPRCLKTKSIASVHHLHCTLGWGITDN
jgi:hypothetical protein